MGTQSHDQVLVLHLVFICGILNSTVAEYLSPSASNSEVLAVEGVCAVWLPYVVAIFGSHVVAIFGSHVIAIFGSHVIAIFGSHVIAIFGSHVIAIFGSCIIDYYICSCIIGYTICVLPYFVVENYKHILNNGMFGIA